VPEIRLGYAVAALAVLAIEVVIALFVRDAFVRPFVGDTLAVVLVCLGLRAITPLGVLPAASIALATAFAVEIGQYFALVDQLGLGDSRVARIVLGTSFAPGDFLAYSIGALAVLAFERLRATR
jgi:uncharacterized protein DUF2809